MFTLNYNLTKVFFKALKRIGTSCCHMTQFAHIFTHKRSQTHAFFLKCMCWLYLTWMVRMKYITQKILNILEINEIVHNLVDL